MCIDTYFPMPIGVRRRRKFWKVLTRNGEGNLISIYHQRGKPIIEANGWMKADEFGFHLFVNIKQAFSYFESMRFHGYSPTILTEVHVKGKMKFGIDTHQLRNNVVLTVKHMKVVEIIREVE